MKYCAHCGAQLNDNDLYCSSCGAKQSSDVVNEELVYANEKAKKEEADTGFIVSILSIVFAILGGGLGLVFGVIGLCIAKDKRSKNLSIVGLVLSIIVSIVGIVIGVLFGVDVMKWIFQITQDAVVNPAV